MLGLPSTTEVGRRIPKEAFYRHMSLDASTRADFVSGVEAVIIANSIKPTTCNFADGKHVHEIIVVQVDAKGTEIPQRVVRAISRANPNKVIVVNGCTHEVTVCDGGRFLSSTNAPSIVLRGENLDEVWDSILAQVALGELDGENVWARIEKHERVKALRDEVTVLEARARKERQVARKNELFAQMRRKQAELEEAERAWK